MAEAAAAFPRPSKVAQRRPCRAFGCVTLPVSGGVRTTDMPGLRDAATQRLMPAGFVALCSLVTGCATAGSGSRWAELSNALDQTERRHLASLERDVETQNASAHRSAAGRPITRRDVIAASRLVRQADALIRQLDRAAALASAGVAERDRLARSLAMQSGRTAGATTIQGGQLRTDFVYPATPAAEPLDYLTLSDMGGTPAAETSDETTAGQSQIDRGPLPGFADTVWRDVKRIHLDLWDDTKRVYWNQTNAVILLVAGGTSLALRPEVDDDIEDYYESHHTLSEGWRDTFGVMGNPAFHFALAGAWYLAGQQIQHDKTYEVGKTLFSALIINGVSTSALKLAACTDSPNGEPFGWPSGHTSSAFTMAAVLHQSYGHLVGIPLYGVAGMVGLARLDDREHHLSDVVFGAAMGLVVGHTVASGHRPQIFGGDLIPFADPTTGAGGLAWFKTTR